MTQQNLAEVLNYSDKAISKWERGESIPDVTVLKQVADYFGVTVDYLLTEEHKSAPLPSAPRRRLFVSVLSAALVWLIATVAFVVLALVGGGVFAPYLTFLYAIPISSIVLLVFNSIWGNRRLNYLIISVLIWSFILSLYLSLLVLASLNIWHLFIIGAPAQIIVILWSGLGAKKRAEVSEVNE